MKPIYQIALSVQDLEASMDELSRALGLRWSEILSSDSLGWKLRVALSFDGPPHFELIEAPPGSPWDASDGPRSTTSSGGADDIDADTERLEREGLTLEHDLGSLRYLLAPQSGLRIELSRGARMQPDGAALDYRTRWALRGSRHERAPLGARRRRARDAARRRPRAVDYHVATDQDRLSSTRSAPRTAR